MSTATSQRRRLFLAGSTLFVGAILTFWLQPMVGRLLLPHYGGSASVWLVCLAAFQFLLLAGYGYAWAISRLPAVTQRLGHLALLLAALLLAWLGPANAAGTVADTTTVAWRVFCDILRLAAIPFAVIAAGSTLIQAWLASVSPPTLSLHTSSPQPAIHNSQLTTGVPPSSGTSIYRLYAWSNLGSLCGLFLYPLLLEPFVSISGQRLAWTAIMTLYALLVAALSAATPSALSTAPADPTPAFPASSPPAADTPPATQFTPVGAQLARRPPAALTLPALSSALLVSVTAQLTQDVVALPLVWAVLLGAFLLSWAAGFSDAAVRRLPWWRNASLLAMAASPLLYLRHGSMPAAFALIAGGAMLVFLCGLWLHATLYAGRPDTPRLPRFYFLIALGGALGGSLTTFAPPLLFPALWELPLILIALLYAITRSTPSANPQSKTNNQKSAILPWLAAVGLAMTCRQSLLPRPGVIWRDRSFYGALSLWQNRITTENGVSGVLRELKHGNTSHGKQFDALGWRDRPLSYYGSLGGAGIAMSSLRRDPAAPQPLRLGLVGLGAGVLCAWALPCDTVVCYEISRPVITAATNPAWFSYIGDSLAQVDIRLGDGRALLAAEQRANAPRFDAIFLDVFSGDATPLHLLTAEAFALYLSRLADDGILAAHVSSWQMDFLPLGKAVAKRFDLDAQAFHSPGASAKLQNPSIWILFSRQRRDYTLPRGVRRCDWNTVADIPLPTDARGSSLRYLGVTPEKCWSPPVP